MSGGGLPGPHSVEAWDQAVWDAFGRQAPGEAALLRDLEECGYTSRGARNALSWINDLGVSEAGLAGGIDGIRPGFLAEEAAGRAMAVLRRHGRLAESTPTGEAESALSPAVVRERDALAHAYWTATPSASQQTAERYAKGAVEQWQETAIRQGWSDKQVVEALRKQRDSVLAKSRTRKGWLAESSPAPTAGASPSLEEWDRMSWGGGR